MKTFIRTCLKKIYEQPKLMARLYTMNNTKKTFSIEKNAVCNSNKTTSLKNLNIKSSFIKVNFVSKPDKKGFRLKSNVYDNFDTFGKMVTRASSFPLTFLQSQFQMPPTDVKKNLIWLFSYIIQHSTKWGCIHIQWANISKLKHQFSQ